MRQSMAQNGHSDLRVQSTLLSISEDEDWVYVRYTDKDGQEHRIRSRFFVGADGKTGYTRKCYLEPRGISISLGSSKSKVEPSVSREPSQLPIMETVVHSFGRLRFILFKGLQTSLQPRAASSMRSIRLAKREDLEVRIRRTER